MYSAASANTAEALRVELLRSGFQLGQRIEVLSDRCAGGRRAGGTCVFQAAVVARETMTRARENVETLYRILHGRGISS